MARSIHTTRRTLKELEETEFSSPSLERRAFGRARKQLERKRWIKNAVATSRSSPPAPREPTPVDLIPIEVRDEGEHVLHAASLDDVRGVLRALPAGATHGVSRIQLVTGRVEFDKDDEHDDEPRDPFIGRRGLQRFPGVWSSYVYGRFRTETGLVSLYAFVVDLAALPMPVAACRHYLRLQALTTLVHELAHHHDLIRRASRPRWTPVDDDLAEDYAEAMAVRWTIDAVLPWLAAQYAGEQRALLSWLHERAGVPVPIEFLAGVRQSSTDVLMSAPEAFEDWLQEDASAQEPDARLGLATRALYVRDGELCLAIVEEILVRYPKDVEARVHRAHVLVGLKRFDDAIAQADELIADEAETEEGWSAKAWALEKQRLTDRLIEHCERWLETVDSRSPWLHLAVAHHLEGRAEESERCLHRTSEGDEAKLERYRRAVVRRARLDS